MHETKLPNILKIKINRDFHFIYGNDTRPFRWKLWICKKKMEWEAINDIPKKGSVISCNAYAWEPLKGQGNKWFWMVFSCGLHKGVNILNKKLY